MKDLIRIQFLNKLTIEHSLVEGVTKIYIVMYTKTYILISLHFTY